ncbi:RNase H domain-containing protein [Trichonephila clavipes]|nr:RNase H domain-containing protein [Trichonephila clavipes]
MEYRLSEYSPTKNKVDDREGQHNTWDNDNCVVKHLLGGGSNIFTEAIVLSRIDYGCVVYGSVCNSTLRKLDPVHHMALRICSGAFRTSPVQSLYVHLQNVYMSTSMKRLYDAWPSNIRPFMDRMKLLVSELNLPNVNIQQRNVLQFQPWNTPRFHYINPFASYSKSTVAPVVFQRVFAYYRSQYRNFSPIFTDGSKRVGYVGCGVVIEDITYGYRLDTSCSVFTAEDVSICRALQLIDSNMPRKYCIYTDNMSVLEALENYTDRCHPVVCNILDITGRLYYKGFDIVFFWLPSHVDIIGNEQADSVARSATTYLPLAVPLSDMKHVILYHILTTCKHKTVKEWVQSCRACQRAKVHKLTKTPLDTFALLDARFSHIHVDYIGFLPPSEGKTSSLTIVDHSTPNNQKQYL